MIGCRNENFLYVARQEYYGYLQDYKQTIALCKSYDCLHEFLKKYNPLQELCFIAEIA